MVGVAAGVVIGYLLLTGKELSPQGLFRGKKATPEACPLTDVAPSGGVPDRPALAVKVENLAAARPQAGLNDADIVYEEPVEGGITRFIAVYHCRDAARIGPIRSARLVDADILRQFGSPVFAFAGGVPAVVSAVEESGAVPIPYTGSSQFFEEDPNRSEPHHVFSSTSVLYEGAAGDPPEPVFSFDPDRPTNEKRARLIHLDFSPFGNVFWRFSPKNRVWLRSHDEEPHTLEDGSRVSAVNVVVQVVKVRPSEILDAAGNPSPEIDAVGSGKAYVFRNGRVIEGRWMRESEDDVTEFVDAGGAEIPLAPGNTWVELFPSDRPIEIG
ncbi:MAG TPA: DUF3048 domain-containing protein [Actinomycetota bacterium]|nr:DUF3048 domain-containing protein [Actinomycetota bacterium]